MNELSNLGPVFGFYAKNAYSIHIYIYIYILIPRSKLANQGRNTSKNTNKNNNDNNNNNNDNNDKNVDNTCVYVCVSIYIYIYIYACVGVPDTPPLPPPEGSCPSTLILWLRHPFPPVVCGRSHPGPAPSPVDCGGFVMVLSYFCRRMWWTDLRIIGMY